MKNKQEKIAKDNVTALMRGEVNFDPKEILNKHCYLTQKIDKERMMEKIIEALKNPMNGEFYIEHSVGLEVFTLKREDGR